MQKKNPFTLVGMFGGLILIFVTISFGGGNINGFISLSSLVITIVGSFASLVVTFPLKDLAKIPKILKLLLISPQSNQTELIEIFTSMAKKARRDGLLALEDDIDQTEDDFLVAGLQMVIDGIEPDTIRDILELKIETAERRHKVGQDIFDKWGEMAPAFGMIGTLIGLIIMLADLQDASAIGTGMATALITTFYGSLFANLVFLPVASNLKIQTEEEMFSREMIIEGILEIQAGTNPRILEEKLMTYVSPEEKIILKESMSSTKEGAYE